MSAAAQVLRTQQAEIQETVRSTELAMRQQIQESSARSKGDVSAYKRQADRDLLKNLGDADHQMPHLLATSVPTQTRENHLKAVIQDLNLSKQKARPARTRGRRTAQPEANVCCHGRGLV